MDRRSIRCHEQSTETGRNEPGARPGRGKQRAARALLSIPGVRTLLLVLAISLAAPLPPLPADPVLPGTVLPGTILWCAEPNDGEVLGSVLLLQFYAFHPDAHRVSVSSGGEILQVVPLSESGIGTATIDITALPNGPVVFEATLLAEDGTVLAVISVTRVIIHPVAALVGALYEAEDLAHVTLAVAAPWAPGASAPYAVLVSREGEIGEISETDLGLVNTPAATRVAATGELSFGTQGTTTLNLPIVEDDVSEESPVHLQILVLSDGKWIPSGSIVITP